MAPAAARVALESLLRDRKLDTTLTTALPLEWAGATTRVPRRGCRRSMPSSRRRARGARFPRLSVRDRRAAPACCARSWRRPRAGVSSSRSSTRSIASIRVGGGGGRRPRACPVGARAGRSVDAAGACAGLGALQAAIRPHARQRRGTGARPCRQGRQPRAPVRRVWARGARHRRCAARRVARAAVQHLDAPAAGRGRERHRVRARGRSPQRPQHQRCEHPAAAAAHRPCAPGGDATPAAREGRSRRVHVRRRAPRPGAGGQAPRHAASREGLAPEAFHAAVLASRRPFVPRTASRGVAGCWAGTASPLPRLRGLAADASVVRAQHHAHATASVALRFVDRRPWTVDRRPVGDRLTR